MKHSQEFYEAEEEVKMEVEKYKVAYNKKSKEEKENPIHKGDNDFTINAYKEQLARVLEEVEYLEQCLSASIIYDDDYTISHIERNKDVVKDLKELADKLL